jgi:nucleotide-binding universal stress UspA family protein
MKLDRVLVPVDLSEPSKRALAEAATLVRGSSGKLTVLHVHAVRQVALLEFSYVEPAEKVAAYFTAAEKQLDGWCRELGLSAEQADTRVVSGDAVTEILAAARDADLIVLGRHSRSALEHLLIGSVAERVARSAPCSVLMVR